jgi:hypothetical protein
MEIDLDQVRLSRVRVAKRRDRARSLQGILPRSLRRILPCALDPSDSLRHGLDPSLTWKLTQTIQAQTQTQEAGQLQQQSQITVDQSLNVYCINGNYCMAYKDQLH